MPNCTYTRMDVTAAAEQEPAISIHCFNVNGVETFMVQPCAPVCDDWYQLFGSKRFDTLEEAMREVLALQYQTRPSVYV